MSVKFWVIGDTPYSSSAAADLSTYINDVPPDVQFIVHLGDIRPGSHTNTDPADWVAASNLLQQSSVPVFIIPGDNEYNDTSSPAAAWANWETYFSNFDQNWTHNFQVSRQSEREENFAFVANGVLFLGINLVGGKKHDAAEWADRQADDLAWIQSNFADFGDQVTSAVVFGHASPGYSGYSSFQAGFIAAAQDFADPILYLQGDKHQWLLDPAQQGWQPAAPVLPS